MSQQEYWRSRAQRALGEHSVKDVIAKTRAIVGPVNIPASEEDAAEAWRKLASGDESPTPDELAALELVIRILRPAPLSRSGKLDDLPDRPGQNLHPQELKDLWSAFRVKVNPVIYSIGRIELNDGTHIGTGFFVADDLIATNRHVLGQLTWGIEIITPNRAFISMKREVTGGDQATDRLSIEEVVKIHPTLDMVILRVLNPIPRPALEIDISAIREGTRIVAIGYPGDDEKRNPFFLKSTFGRDFGFKRAALGEILSGSGNPTLFHDCSTTGGSSGSPIFDLDTGKVLGIHRSGFFLFRNEGVHGDRLQQLINPANPV
ncbi:serine protease [Verrucomicrobiaceae bacterium 227]